MTTYKIVLVGDGGVGKSVWLNRYSTGEFEPLYQPTLGIEVHPIVFYTNYGNYVLNIWDTAGQEKYGGLRDGYYINADGVVAMFDNTSRLSVKNLPKWIADVHRVVSNIPVVICGNKSDMPNQVISSDEKLVVICGAEKQDMNLSYKYYDISAKSNHQIEKPFLYLLQTISGHTDLKIVNAPPIVLPLP